MADNLLWNPLLCEQHLSVSVFANSCSSFGIMKETLNNGKLDQVLEGKEFIKIGSLLVAFGFTIYSGFHFMTQRKGGKSTRHSTISPSLPVYLLKENAYSISEIISIRYPNWLLIERKLSPLSRTVSPDTGLQAIPTDLNACLLPHLSNSCSSLLNNSLTNAHTSAGCTSAELGNRFSIEHLLRGSSSNGIQSPKFASSSSLNQFCSTKKINRDSACTAKTVSTASGSQEQDILEETDHQEQPRNSRTSTPASTSSLSIAPNGFATAGVHEANAADPVLMTTFYPGLDYTWICPSKQMQRKRTVRDYAYD